MVSAVKQVSAAQTQKTPLLSQCPNRDSNGVDFCNRKQSLQRAGGKGGIPIRT